MKRLIDYYLLSWKNDTLRQPLLLRGARQVGKTHAVRELGKTYDDFVEINLESNRRAHIAFEKNLEPQEILLNLASVIKKEIIPGKTLLFLDEIQAKPDAITALRYFYEMMPELHVIAAGSLLDFAIEKVGIPVGRVQSLYLYPMSFIEFLAAEQEFPLIKALIEHDVQHEIGAAIHQRAIELVGQYLAIGGMPRVVHQWTTTKQSTTCATMHAAIIDTYRQDFGKYARQAQVKYVDKVFESVPVQLGRKFKYSSIDGDYRKRELAPALDLLVVAGVAHKICHTSGHGVPLGAQASMEDYKVIALDVGINQAILGHDSTNWLLHPLIEFVNKGPLVEAFIGQEMLAYADPHRKKGLYYWHREAASSQAEVDFILEQGSLVLPIEVKSGTGQTLKSIRLFLETHPASTKGIRFSINNFSHYEKIQSLPLYAVIRAFTQHHQALQEAIVSLLD